MDQVITPIICDACLAPSHLRRVRLLLGVFEHVPVVESQLSFIDPFSHAAFLSGPVGLQENSDWPVDALSALRYRKQQ